MKSIVARLTKSDLHNNLYNAAILVFRVAISLELIIVHGLKKIGAGGNELEIVPNPFGLDPSLNQFLAASSDLVFPLLIILGVGTRLATIPILVVTLTGYFIMHAGESLAEKDISFIYSMSFFLIAIIGAGKFSFDYAIFRLVTNNKSKHDNGAKSDVAISA